MDELDEIILVALVEDGKHFNRLVKELGIPRPTLTKHLKGLEERGRVFHIQDGQKKTYYLKEPSEGFREDLLHHAGRLRRLRGELEEGGTPEVVFHDIYRELVTSWIDIAGKGLGEGMGLMELLNAGSDWAAVVRGVLFKEIMPVIRMTPEAREAMEIATAGNRELARRLGLRD